MPLKKASHDCLAVYHGCCRIMKDIKIEACVTEILLIGMKNLMTQLMGTGWKPNFLPYVQQIKQAMVLRVEGELATCVCR